jgi:vacuolar-type H+-ATPase subunit E/Vma4
MELLRKIEEEGVREVQEILDNAEKESQKLLADAETELTAWRQERMSASESEIEGERRLITSRARAKAREVVLRAKGHAAERLFDDLAREAGEFRTDKRVYKAFLTRCLKESESQIDGSLVLEIDPKDKEIVSEVIKGSKHSLGREIRSMGGFIATNASGDLLVDNRLETRISNLRQQHRSELSGELFS